MAAYKCGLLQQCWPKILRSVNGLDLTGRYPVLWNERNQASLHTCPCLMRKSRWKKKSYEDLPKPDLKPIGPEDYQRWRHFLKPSEVQPQALQPTDKHISKGTVFSFDIFNRVNEQIKNESHGRLFAVVQIAGKQFKVTTEDIVIIQGTFVPNIGSIIRLEKVLVVGSSDFTLLGRPLLSKDLVRIEATVIEKTLSHIMTNFKMKRRKQYRRINFYRIQYTMLRINEICFHGLANSVKDVEGLEGRIIG